MSQDVFIHPLEDEPHEDDGAAAAQARIDRMVREVRTFPQPELIPWFFERLDRSAQATQALVWVALIAIGVVALSAFAALA